MAKMVEEVAKALWLEAATFADKAQYWLIISESDKEPYYNGARAAIEAMREPTEAMLEAVFEADRESVAAVWPEMIDAALAEPA